MMQPTHVTTDTPAVTYHAIPLGDPEDRQFLAQVQDAAGEPLLTSSEREPYRDPVTARHIAVRMWAVKQRAGDASRKVSA